jgi:hypothetical protein
MDLLTIPPADYTKCFILTADIDLNGASYQRAVIAPSGEFAGVFDGNGHKITRFSINGGSKIGLFETISKTGKVKNLGIENFTIKVPAGSNYAAGGLAAYNKGLIRNCHAMGIVEGYNSVGGLVGYNDYGMIINCRAAGTISGSGYYTGGVTGSNYYGYIGGCFSAGTVTGTFYAGGLVGINFSGRIANSYSTAAVTSYSVAGGLAGSNKSDSDISHCYSTGFVTGTSSVGGLAGYNAGIINQSYWDMETSGQKTSAGGIGKTTAEMQQQHTYTSSSLITGKIGNALKLDGLDDYVEVPGYYGIGGANSRTVSLWIKTSTANCFHNQQLVEWGGPNQGRFWTVYLSDCRKVVVSDGRRNYDVYSSKSLTDGQWHHVAAVLEQSSVDSGQIKIYIDGVLDRVGPANSVIYTHATSPVRIGKPDAQEQAGTAYHMDDIRIYNRALTALEFTPTYKDGLVAHWKLDETQGSTVAYDSADSHDGTLYNMAAGSWVAGKTGNALQFDGINDYVQMTDYTGIIGANPRTISLWVKTSVSSQIQSMVHWGEDSTGQLWKLFIQTDGTVRMGAFEGAVYSKRSIADNQWHHIAAVLGEGQTRSDQIRLYVDGQPDTIPTTFTCTINTSGASPVHLGAWCKPSTGARSEYFKGLLDEVCIYNRALAPSEFFPQISLPADGLAACWSMDTIENNIVYESVFGYHGILVNSSEGYRWDFVNESVNGTSDYWAMPAAGGYPVLAAFGGYTPPKPEGLGTETNPYLITNAAQLGTIWSRPEASYRLTNDINLEGIRWGMAVIPEFCGKLDGDGFRIKNLNINGGYYLGLIGRNNTLGQVKNLGLENTTIKGKEHIKYAGALAGYNYGSFDQCFSAGSVSGASDSSYIGGITGYNNRGMIQQCYSTCSVGAVSNSYCGGLVGSLDMSTNTDTANIIDCYSAGLITGSWYKGGLVGGSGLYVNPKILNSFWDIQTAMYSTSFGGTGKLTADMKNRATYTCFSWTAGKTGNALSFNTGRDYVNVPDLYGITGANPRTVSLWVKMPPDGGIQTLIHWGYDTTGKTWKLFIQADGTARLGAYSGAVYSTRSVADNHWHHIAAVLENGTNRSDQIKLYIDGQLDTVPTASVCTINTLQGAPIHLGVWYAVSNGTYTEYFKGTMDDVRIYSRALAASEIIPESLPSSGLSCHWALDETGGHIAYNSGLVPANAILKNSAWNMVPAEYDGMDHVWFIRQGKEYPRFTWEDLEPVAKAGNDISVHCPATGFAEIQLNGSASVDPENDAITYLWNWMIDGLPYTATGAAPKIQLPPGTYEITLVVNDGVWDSEPDTVKVSIYNTAPVADAGDDMILYQDFESDTVEAILDGGGSIDPDGDTITYKWYLDMELLAEGVKPTVSLPSGQHTITLIVNDGIEDSPADEILVTVVRPVRTRIVVLPTVFNLKSQNDYIWILMYLPRDIKPAQIDSDYGYFILPGRVVPKEVRYLECFNPTAAAKVYWEQLKQNLSPGKVEVTFFTRLKDGRFIGGSNMVLVIDPPGEKPKYRVK